MRRPGLPERIVIDVAVDIVDDGPDVVMFFRSRFKNITVLVCNVTDAAIYDTAVK